ncbi:energy-coupling factor transporter transmembrane component T family protein [Halalkalibacterium ligniniphilum]|nr:energy-coupling factor transporter transmembrane component T [Halalkalibacterium ligniniphilum]
MATAFVEEMKRFDPGIDSSSWGAAWEPRTKTISCILFTFGVVYLENIMLLGFVFTSLIMLAKLSQFSFRFILSKLVLLVPFLLLMSIPILLSNGFPIDGELLRFVLQISLKSGAALLVMMILVLSQPLHQLLNSLSALPIPGVIVSILSLTVTYTRMFYRSLTFFYKALVSRLFRPSAKPASLKVYSGVMAGVIMKAVDQSDKVYQAMAARGFSGKIPTSPPRPISKTDWIKSASILGFILIIILIEKWWF